MLSRERARMARGLPEPCGQCSYNEVMVDGFHHNDELPHSIEAWVVGADDDRSRAEEVHGLFLAEYGLTASDVPLLTYHRDRDATGGDVFTL